MADLTEALVRAQQAGDKQAEQQLQQYAASDYPAFVKALSAELSNEQKPQNARQLAGLYLKNTLHSKTAAVQQSKHDRWKQLDTETRNTVKNSLMQAFSSATPGIPKYAAIVAAEIAGVELPYNEWPDLVGQLHSAIMSPQAPEAIKVASFECLGQIFQTSDHILNCFPDSPVMDDAVIDTILTTLVSGNAPDRPSNERFASLKSLNQSLTFVSKNMEVKAERDAIVQCFAQACASTDARMRELAFQSFDLLADLYYDHMQDYITEIYNLSMAAIQNQNEDEEVQKSAVEFWTGIASTELELTEDEERAREEQREIAPKCKKYTEHVAKTILPALLKTLTLHGDDVDEDTNDLRAAGATCIVAISETIKSAIVDHVIGFVQQNVASDNWQMRDAAIVAFSCIQDGPSTAVLAKYLSTSVEVLVQSFGFPNEIVQDSAVHCIGRMCKAHIAAYMDEQVHFIINALLGKLNQSPKVAASAAQALFNIAASFKSPTEIPGTNVLSSPMEHMLRALVAIMDRPDGKEHKLWSTAISTTADLVLACARDKFGLLNELLPVILNKMAALLQNGSHLSDDDAEIMGLMCGIITSIYQRCDTNFLLGHSDNVVELLLKILQIQSATCHEEALYAMGAIATKLEAAFVKYLPALAPFLTTALYMYDQSSMLIVGVGVVTDVCDAVEEGVLPYCNDFVGALAKCLQQGATDREIKPVAVSCLGDIAMAISGNFEAYLDATTMLLMQAANASAETSTDEFAMDFINRLRLAVLEAYTGVIMGLSAGNKLNLFIAKNLDNVLQFLQYLSTPQSMKDDQVLEKAVALLGDVAQSMGNVAQIQNQFRQPFVAALVTQAQQCPNPEAKQIGAWTQHEIQKALAARP